MLGLYQIQGVLFELLSYMMYNRITCITAWNLFVLYFGVKEPSKRRPFSIKTGVIWVPGNCISIERGTRPFAIS